MTTAYDLKALSPLDFEELVRDLLQAEWDVTLESFGPGRDQGIDARYAQGPDKLIVQAKHMEASGYSALLAALRKERGKALLLAPTRYVLATSLSLNPARKEQIRAVMAGVPLADADILGREDILNLVGRHERVERRHFKLWLASTAVLERILHSKVYNRTAAEISTIRKKLPLFVPNASVEDAEAKLAGAGTLILQGAPGVGKTTLAQMLLWLHAEQGWEIFVVDTLDEALTFAQGETKRLILLDDFLGQYRLSADHMRGIDARFPPLVNRIASSPNLRFILTTRDYILAQARAMSQRLAPEAVDARDYVLSVGTYTRAVKARILYNHLHFSKLGDAERAEVLADDFFLRVIDHKNFNPRIIELLTNPAYLALTNRPLRETIETVLANPEILWDIPYRQHIDADGRALMIALFLNGRVASPEMLKAAFARFVGALGGSVHPADLETRFKAAFRALDGSVLAVNMGLVLFANPGLNDFLEGVIVADHLVPVLLPAVATPFELHNLWALFAERAAGHGPGGPEWTEAFDRTRAHGADSFAYLEMALEFYVLLGHAPLLDRIEEFLAIIETLPVLEDSLSWVRSLLEESGSIVLPEPSHSRFRSIMTKLAATYLVQYGPTMGFEDFEAFEGELHDHADDPAVALAASRDALGDLVHQLEVDLREIDTVEDLDEFEASLLDLMRRRGVSTKKAVSEIDYRREQLYEEGSVSRRGGYRGQGGANEAGASDRDIRSMFGGLLPSD